VQKHIGLSLTQGWLRQCCSVHDDKLFFWSSSVLRLRLPMCWEAREMLPNLMFFSGRCPSRRGSNLESWNRPMWPVCVNIAHTQCCARVW